MRIVIHSDALSAARASGRVIADAILANPRLVLGLPAGRTPVPMYAEIVAIARRERLDFSRVTTFNLDEFCGIGPEHPGSFRRYMDEHLVRHVDLAGERVQFPGGDAADPAEECSRYDEAIRAAGGIDLQVLGIGGNGHVGFNEPAPVLEARTHVVELANDTRRANAPLFGGDPAGVPARGITVGMGAILGARAVLLLATGPAKAAAVGKMVSGRIDPYVPATFLLLHRALRVMLDRDAAGQLPVNPPPDVEIHFAR